MPGDPRALISHINGLEEEAELRKANTPLGDAELNARFLRGEQWSTTTGPASPFRSEQYRFVMNIVNQTVKRHVALLTDSRPQIDVVARSANKKGTAEIYKNVTGAIWDETNFEQASTRELVRAATIGSTVCVPIWDATAQRGAGQLAFRMFDPRQVKIDPQVVHAVDVQRLAQYFIIREPVALNLIRESYQSRGWDVRPDARWSRYGRNQRVSTLSGYRGIATAMQIPWKRRDEESQESLSPRAELRHTWFRDWERDLQGQPIRNRPMHIRYVVDDGRETVLKDETLVYLHGEIPAHIFDWDIEFEHPYGIPMVSGLRRLQYTLNRIFGQVVENVILTNRVKVISDTNAVDPSTWKAITENPNGIYIRKRQGHTFQYELPANVVPAYIPQVIQMILQGMDMVTGMTEGTSGKMPKGGNISGVALDALQIQAQSVIRLVARQYENWLERIFQQVLPLIWQYYTADRLLHMVGPGPKLAEFEFNRQQFMQGDDKKEHPSTAWQDFEFKVIPGSSLSMTRIQKGVIALNLRQAGLLSGVDALKAVEWPDPEGTFQRAQADQQAGGGPGARTSRKMMKLPSSTRAQKIGV